MFFFFHIKEKIVGPATVLRDQYILCVIVPAEPVTVLVSVEA